MNKSANLNLLNNLFKVMRFRLILVILVGTIAMISTIALMGLSAWLISTASLQVPLYVLSLAIVGVRCCGIMRAVFRYLERYLLHQIGFKLFTKFRVSVLKQVTTALPFSKPSNRNQQTNSTSNTFDIIVNAVDSLRDNFLRFFLPPITATIVTFLAIFWLSYYSFLLAILLFISWLLFAIILPFTFFNAYHRHSKLFKQKHSISLVQQIMDFYEGNLELQTYNYQEDKLSSCNISILQYQNEQESLFKLKSKITMYSEILASLFLVILFALLINLVGQYKFNAVMAITILLSLQALWENLSLLPALTKQVHEAKEDFQSLKPFINKTKFIAKENSPIKSYNLSEATILTVENLSFGYTTPILKNLNFKLTKNKKILLLGESGCGKSTLFYVLTKVLEPMKGNIFLHEKNYQELTTADIEENIAVSFQNHHLFQMSIKENFRMIYPKITDEEIIISLNSVDLKQFATKKGLDYQINQDGNNLSGGQKHRLQLAICLAKQKNIILLDEPTAGLDIKSAKSFLNKLISSYNDTTMFVSSHDLSLLDYFDDVIILANKTIIEQGEIKRLLQDRKTFLSKLINYHNMI